MGTNTELLERAAESVASLLDELVFVGGAVAELYITQQVADRPRPTTDADVICQAATYTEYGRLGDKLRELGFSQTAASSDPPYRWRQGTVLLDVMPIDPSVFGFTNQWYEPGVREAVRRRLDNGLEIQVLSAPYHLATKIVAYVDRGDGDPHTSPDFEDIVGLLANRPEIADEIAGADEEVATWLRKRLAELFPEGVALEYLAANLPYASDAELVDIMWARIQTITQR